MIEQQDVHWMRIALKEAAIAASLGEVPVGAVLVQNNQLLSQAHNTRESDHKVSSHAEIKAIDLASQSHKSWRFPEATLYVTVEPCLMCTGAILQSQIKRIVFGTREPKTGAMVSILHVEKIPNLPRVAIQEGVLQHECEQLMTSFFGGKREP